VEHRARGPGPSPAQTRDTAVWTPARERRRTRAGGSAARCALAIDTCRVQGDARRTRDPSPRATRAPRDGASSTGPNHGGRPRAKPPRRADPRARAPATGSARSRCQLGAPAPAIAQDEGNMTGKGLLARRSDRARSRAAPILDSRTDASWCRCLPSGAAPGRSWSGAAMPAGRARAGVARTGAARHRLARCLAGAFPQSCHRCSRGGAYPLPGRWVTVFAIGCYFPVYLKGLVA